MMGIFSFLGESPHIKGDDLLLIQQEKPLVLASASPRRHEILSRGGVEHIVRPSYIDESVFQGLEPRIMVQLLAASKAAAAAENEDAWILGADTVVVLDGKTLGKPVDAADAMHMLSMLSGRSHFVYTGIALLCAKTGRLKTHCEETVVTFRSLSEEEIRAYVQTGEPLDKAGSYGIQGLGGALVESTKGDIENVIGLPFNAVKRLFAEMNK